jgi:CRP/FNR family nitrogen fixation transcriptional regulator
MQTAQMFARPAPSPAIFMESGKQPNAARPSAAEPAGAARHYAKDEEIFSEGNTATHLYKVVSGAVRTSKLLSDGRRQIDAFHLPGDIFGVEPDSEHRFTAEAVSETVVVAYRRSNTRGFLPLDEPLGPQVVAAIMRSLARAQDHMLLLGRKTALEKIATFLLEMAQRVSAGTKSVDLPMSRNDIADYLGLTIETVSRTLTSLERKRVIEIPTARRAIGIRNLAALTHLTS